MEQGSQIVMNLTAFDRRMEEFDPEQYEFMIFDIEIEKTGVQRGLGLQAIQDTENKRQFFGIGHYPGRFQVSATTERFRPSPGPFLASNILGIEVFPFLEIIPTKLLLTPNMRYTLRIQGGPQKETTDF